MTLGKSSTSLQAIPCGRHGFLKSDVHSEGVVNIDGIESILSRVTRLATTEQVAARAIVDMEVTRRMGQNREHSEAV